MRASYRAGKNHCAKATDLLSENKVSDLDTGCFQKCAHWGLQIIIVANDLLPGLGQPSSKWCHPHAAYPKE
jgi:hypothetical protein